MSGAFGEMQAIYAGHHIATYPLAKNKTPAVRSYQRVGAKGSRRLALKFADAAAFGFLAGPRNRLTVVDIDSPDDRLAAEIEARYGPTPLQVVTPSGGRHLYYRNNGEARRIRPMASEPVDILGGGNVVAALSVVPKGRYDLVRGSLDDLPRLPTMRPRTRREPPAGRVPEGERNTALFGYCRTVVGHCDDFEQLLDAAMTWADGRLAPPLPPAEIRRTCRSVWQYQGGRKRVMNHIVERPQYAALIANTDALALFAYLSAENGPDAKFMVADGLATARGWPRRFVPNARKALIEMGLIECVRPSGRGTPALYRWRVSP